MSRVYWHTKARTAELAGSERAWLAHVANGPATAAWDLDTVQALERAAEILALVPEVPDGEHGANYLHRYLREAQAQHERNMSVYRAWVPGTPLPGSTSHAEERRLTQALRTALRVSGLKMLVAGVELHTANLDANTALVAGSDPVRLAAKIANWSSSHCWVEGPDRAWLAGIIDQGLAAGIYRRGLWYSTEPDGPRDKHATQGWEDVLVLLREADDQPVVLSYSVNDVFPNPDIAGWRPPPMPDGWAPDWAAGDGRADWERDYPHYVDRESYYRDAATDQWYDLPFEDQWDMALTGLRAQRPWARLSPETLASQAFGWPPVTVYDLFAPDRDERVTCSPGTDTKGDN